MGGRIPWHMATIDERPEDIYTQVKKTPHHYRHKASKVHFNDKNKSKSMTDLQAWETVAHRAYRKANTLDNLASMDCSGNPNTAAAAADEVYRAQLDRMYAEVALAYVRANIYNGEENKQPPQLDEYLRQRYAEMIASDKSINQKASDVENESSMTHTWPLASHLLDDQAQPPAPELNDDSPPLMDFTSVHSATTSNQTLTSGLMDNQSPATNNTQEEEEDDEEEEEDYDRHIAEYRPYQIPPPNRKRAAAASALYTTITQDNNKQSTVRSYESIRSEHMIKPKQQLYQDVPL